MSATEDRQPPYFILVVSVSDDLVSGFSHDLIGPIADRETADKLICHIEMADTDGYRVAADYIDAESPEESEWTELVVIKDRDIA